MRYMIYPVLALLALLASPRPARGETAPAAPAAPGDPAIQARTDWRGPEGTLRVGDRAELDVIVEWRGGGYSVRKTEFSEKPHGWILDATSPETLEPGEEKAGRPNRWRKTFRLRAALPGELKIPALNITYLKETDPDASGELLTLPEKTVHVESPGELSEADKLEEFTLPETLPYDWTRRNLLIAGSLLAAAGLVAGGLALKKRFAGAAVFAPAPAPPRPPHEVALEALDALAASPLLDEGRVKEYHSELSEILRRYVGARFDRPALDWTTEEILFSFERDGRLGPRETLHLAGILEACDRVKFAKWIPARGESVGALDDARRFIEVTRPAPGIEKPEPEEGAAPSAAAPSSPASGEEAR